MDLSLIHQRICVWELDNTWSPSENWPQSLWVSVSVSLYMWSLGFSQKDTKGKMKSSCWGLVNEIKTHESNVLTQLIAEALSFQGSCDYSNILRHFVPYVSLFYYGLSYSRFLYDSHSLFVCSLLLPLDLSTTLFCTTGDSYICDFDYEDSDPAYALLSNTTLNIIKQTMLW